RRRRSRGIGTARGARRRSPRRAQLAEQSQPVLELARRAEVVTHGFPPGRAHGVGLRGVAEQVGAAVGGLFDIVDEVAVHTVFDLQRDPTATPADNRTALPHALAHSEAETFA